MQEDSEQLDEIVVIGYGEVKKSDLTGAVSVIQAEELENVSRCQNRSGLTGACNRCVGNNA